MAEKKARAPRRSPGSAPIARLAATEEGARALTLLRHWREHGTARGWGATSGSSESTPGWPETGPALTPGVVDALLELADAGYRSLDAKASAAIARRRRDVVLWMLQLPDDGSIRSIEDLRARADAPELASIPDAALDEIRLQWTSIRFPKGRKLRTK